MRKVAVVGVGMTQFGQSEKTQVEMFSEAAMDASVPDREKNHRGRSMPVLRYSMGPRQTEEPHSGQDCSLGRDIAQAHGGRNKNRSADRDPP